VVQVTADNAAEAALAVKRGDLPGPAKTLAEAVCRRCGQTRPLSFFLKKPDGSLRKPCVPCVTARNRAYRHANPGFTAKRNATRRAKNPKPPTPAERFAKYVTEGQPDSCWVWTGNTVSGGYGLFGLRGRQVLAHRFAYERAFGPIPDGQKVLHRCDNPPCCNPAHLFAGTQADNVRDMLAKGRQRCPVGERHPKAKLTTAQVLALRADFASGVTEPELVRKYHTTRGTVRGIVTGKSRKTEVLS
jgi:hypothetical protein